MQQRTGDACKWSARVKSSNSKQFIRHAPRHSKSQAALSPSAVQELRQAAAAAAQLEVQQDCSGLLVLLPAAEC
jgi:hypothetical protein